MGSLSCRARSFDRLALYRRRGTRRAKQAATVTAAVAAPLVNTGLFLVGCALFFYDTVLELAAVAGFESGVAYMFLGLAGGNFLLELIINLVLCPAILLILDVLHVDYVRFQIKHMI